MESTHSVFTGNLRKKDALGDLNIRG